jgi:TonB-dependent SusC/RagA subfamily outer membrane receptor
MPGATMIRLPALLACAVLAACSPAAPRSAPAPRDEPAGSSAAGRGNATGDGELDQQRPVAQAEELLEGRFAGVRVQRVPGGIVVRIRGATSVMGSEEPLYVVDGMEMAPGPGGALMGINPADIARIEVLKDIGSTSAYGVRGANGVVLITTRRN